MCTSSPSATSAISLMNASTAAAVKLEPPVLMRNSSSVDGSDFEFDFSAVGSHDEPLDSPKLHNFSPIWKSVASNTPASSAKHIYTDAPHTQYLEVIDVSGRDRHGPGADFDINDSPLYRYHGSGVTDINQYHFSRDGGCLNGASAGDVHAGVIMSTSPDDDENPKKSTDLRCSMALAAERRELEQLFPAELAGWNRGYDDGNDSNNADDLMWRCSRSSSESSSPNSSSVSSPQHRPKKKSMRWSLKLDFLRAKKPKSPSSKAAHHGVVDELSDTNCHEAAEISDYESGTAEESRGRISVRSAASSSMSSSGSGSSAGKGEKAASPFSAASNHANGHGAGVKGGMWLHAQHYQQQRAVRAEELQRRTVLPYRHSLLGAHFQLQRKEGFVY